MYRSFLGPCLCNCHSRRGGGGYQGRGEVVLSGSERKRGSFCSRSCRLGKIPTTVKPEFWILTASSRMISFQTLRSSACVHAQLHHSSMGQQDTCLGVCLSVLGPVEEPVIPSRTPPLPRGYYLCHTADAAITTPLTGAPEFQSYTSQVASTTRSSARLSLLGHRSITS